MTMKMKAQHYKNAADPEFPATDLANAPARAEFKLGIFPPDHHVPPATPTPAPAGTTSTQPLHGQK